jgi:hypothetical protein
MKKMTRFIPIIVAMMLIATSCNNSTGSMSSASPKEVLHEFFERMGNKDIEGAAKLATKDSKSMLDMAKQGLEMAEKFKNNNNEENDPSKKFKDAEIGEARIEGDNAYVPYKSKTEDVQIDFPLKKEDGSWKVDFSMSTLMKMGWDHAKKQGMVNDSMSLDQMKDMMEKGMKMKDSIMKNLDPSVKEKIKEGLKSYDTLMKAN